MSVPSSKAHQAAAQEFKPPMNWYYSVEGRSNGPVSQQDLFRLAKEGIVGTDTLLWHPGLEEWDPLWKLLPQATEHLTKVLAVEPIKGDTERVPLTDQEKTGRVILSESRFQRMFARLRRS